MPAQNPWQNDGTYLGDDGFVHYADGTLLDSDGTFYHPDGSMSTMDGRYYAPIPRPPQADTNPGGGLQGVVHDDRPWPGQHSPPSPPPASAPDQFDAIYGAQPEDGSRHTWGDELAIGARGLARGVAGLPDMLLENPLIATSNGLFGTHWAYNPLSRDVDALFDRMGAVRPVTSAENYADAINSGAGGVLAGMGAGGLAGTAARAAPTLARAGAAMLEHPVAQMLSSAAGGAGSEAARQAGLDPGWQLAAGLAGGAVPGLAGAAGRGAATLGRMAARGGDLTPEAAAFERQGASMYLGDVGKPGRMFSYLAGDGGAVPSMRAAAQRTMGHIQRVGDEVANAIGQPMVDRTQAGEYLGDQLNAVQDARYAGVRQQAEDVTNRIGTPYPDRTEGGTRMQDGLITTRNDREEAAGQLYKALPIDRQGTNIDLTGPRAWLTAMTRGLESNPELSVIWAGNPQLQATLDAMTPRETAASRAADMADAQQGYATMTARWHGLNGQMQAIRQAREQVLEQQQQARLLGQPTVPYDVKAAHYDAQAAELQPALDLAHQQLTGAEQHLSSQVARGETRLQDGHLSWGDAHSLRSIVGKIIQSPAFTTADQKARGPLVGLYRELSQSLKNAPGTIADQTIREPFDLASNNWEQLQQLQRDIFRPLLGKDFASNVEPEKAWDRWAAWAGNKGSVTRMAQVLRSVPEETANAMRATLFKQLSSDEMGNFDAAKFGKWWDTMPDHARAMLFPGDDSPSATGGHDYRAKMADLVTMVKHSEAAQSAAGAKLSDRKGGMDALQQLPRMAVEFMGGRLLTNPRFVRWLSSSAKAPPPGARVPSVLARLTTVARASPGWAAQDVLDFQHQAWRAWAEQQEQ